MNAVTEIARLIESTNVAEGVETKVFKKTPRVGIVPKRGVKAQSLKLLSDVDYKTLCKPHHQKDLLIEVLKSFDYEATVAAVVDFIEADDELLGRLKTIQAPYNCVMYHAKQLQKLKLIEISDKVVKQEEFEEKEEDDEEDEE
jgi:hypothetical protein